MLRNYRKVPKVLPDTNICPSYQSIGHRIIDPNSVLVQIHLHIYLSIFISLYYYLFITICLSIFLSILSIYLSIYAGLMDLEGEMVNRVSKLWSESVWRDFMSDHRTSAPTQKGYIFLDNFKRLFINKWGLR